MSEKTENAHGQFLGFDPLTLVPIDLDAIDPALLTQEECEQLNAYHARVYEALSPFLDEEECAFLQVQTRAV